MSATAAAAAAALWRCYKDVYATSAEELGWTGRDVDRRDAAVLEDVLCGLRQQQLFQLHLLRQLQRQIDQLVVGEALQGSRQVPVAGDSPTAAVGPGPGSGSPAAAVPAAAPPYHVTAGAPMTSQQSPMSAMIDMSRKQLSQLPNHARAPSADRQ